MWLVPLNVTLVIFTFFFIYIKSSTKNFTPSSGLLNDSSSHAKSCMWPHGHILVWFCTQINIDRRTDVQKSFMHNRQTHFIYIYIFKNLKSLDCPWIVYCSIVRCLLEWWAHPPRLYPLISITQTAKSMLLISIFPYLLISVIYHISNQTRWNARRRW